MDRGGGCTRDALAPYGAASEAGAAGARLRELEMVLSAVLWPMLLVQADARADGGRDTARGGGSGEQPGGGPAGATATLHPSRPPLEEF
jgi:hypothetical protein